jgi:hypothetical protein
MCERYEMKGDRRTCRMDLKRQRERERKPALIETESVTRIESIVQGESERVRGRGRERESERGGGENRKRDARCAMWNSQICGKWSTGMSPSLYATKKTGEFWGREGISTITRDR